MSKGEGRGTGEVNDSLRAPPPRCLNSTGWSFSPKCPIVMLPKSQCENHVDGTGFLLHRVGPTTGGVGLESLIDVESGSCQTLSPRAISGGAMLTLERPVTVLC